MLLLTFLVTHRYNKFSSPLKAFLDIFLIWWLLRRLKNKNEQNSTMRNRFYKHKNSTRYSALYNRKTFTDMAY